KSLQTAVLRTSLPDVVGQCYGWLLTGLCVPLNRVREARGFCSRALLVIAERARWLGRDRVFAWALVLGALRPTESLTGLAYARQTRQGALRAPTGLLLGYPAHERQQEGLDGVSHLG